MILLELLDQRKEMLLMKVHRWIKYLHMVNFILS
jgi:hypothetical protein